MGATEPDDIGAMLRAFSKPMICRQENGREHWPINGGPDCAEDEAWGIILGIERGRFRHDRAGFLQWSELGRERSAAVDSATYTEASRQEIGIASCGARGWQYLYIS